MKESIIIGLMLIMSVFAGAFVLADNETEDNETVEFEDNETDENDEFEDNETDESEDNETVELEDVELEGIETEEIEDLIESGCAYGHEKRIGFTTVRTGNGWMNNEDDGKLINVFWASQKVANIDGEEIVSEMRAGGSLKIAGEGAYRLVRISEEDSNESDSTISFHVLNAMIGLKDKNKTEESREKCLNEELTDEDYVGTLTLNKEHEYENLVIWNGELVLTEGDLTGSWDVSIASNVNTIKPKRAMEVANLDQGRKVGFFERFKFWKRDKVKLQGEVTSFNPEGRMNNAKAQGEGPQFNLEEKMNNSKAHSEKPEFNLEEKMNNAKAKGVDFAKHQGKQNK